MLRTPQLEAAFRSYSAASASWEPFGDAAFPEVELVDFLRHSQARVSRCSKDELCSLFTPWADFITRLGDNPLAMLSPVGDGVLASALQLLHKADSASTERHSRLHREWCAQFVRRVSGGPPASPTPLDSLLAASGTPDDAWAAALTSEAAASLRLARRAARDAPRAAAAMRWAGAAAWWGGAPLRPLLYDACAAPPPACAEAIDAACAEAIDAAWAAGRRAVGAPAAARLWAARPRLLRARLEAAVLALHRSPRLLALAAVWAEAAEERGWGGGGDALVRMLPVLEPLALLYAGAEGEAHESLWHLASSCASATPLVLLQLLHSLSRLAAPLRRGVAPRGQSPPAPLRHLEWRLSMRRSFASLLFVGEEISRLLITQEAPPRDVWKAFTTSAGWGPCALLALVAGEPPPPVDWPAPHAEGWVHSLVLWQWQQPPQLAAWLAGVVESLRSTASHCGDDRGEPGGEAAELQRLLREWLSDAMRHEGAVEALVCQLALAGAVLAASPSLWLHAVAALLEERCGGVESGTAELLPWLWRLLAHARSAGCDQRTSPSPCNSGELADAVLLNVADWAERTMPEGNDATPLICVAQAFASFASGVASSAAIERLTSVVDRP
ncbi:hypothetical protein AB1Y20_005974 [Prymnesium parvum]|uniref:Uncharacterized protein n=1 Tax=Prymnesium parvum TaxID=97485 RepID=A0AB34J144_PRYPA